MLDTCALAKHAALVAVPATLALGDPMWALVPLVEAARTPEAQGETARTPEGLLIRPLRAVVELENVVLIQRGTYRPGREPYPEGLESSASYVVQERDDGFRQRRWLVEHYTARWNELVDLASSLDDLACDEHLSHLSGLFEDEVQERVATPDPERRVELDRLLVRHLTGLKVLEARLSAGRVARIDESTLHEAIAADVRDVRPYGILDALAYDAVSTGSETASWGRDDAGVRRLASFTRDDFFRWAHRVTGYNRTYVTAALNAFPPTALLMKRGRKLKGSQYPEVLAALRTRGAALLARDPARRLWSQGLAGTTIDEPASPGAVILPRGYWRGRKR